MEEQPKKENILETGEYVFLGPENGDISMDTLELHAGSGAKRIWKVKSLSREEIVFKVVKFG